VFVIGSVKKGFAGACKRAGISDYVPHDLRHTFASWLVQKGVSLYEVRDILGHSSIKLTERYAHLAPENLVGAISKLGSL
jgi:site-specific recombinase XerD